MKFTALRHSFKFDNFDRFASFIKQGNIVHSQLSVGEFNGSLSQVICGPVILSCHRMNQTISQKGTGLKGFTTFLLPGNLEQDFNWRKSRLRGNVIGILRSGMEHSCVTRFDFLALLFLLKTHI